MFDTMPETQGRGRVLGGGSVSGAVLLHAVILFTLVGASVLARVEPPGAPPLPSVSVFLEVTPDPAKLGDDPNAGGPAGQRHPEPPPVEPSRAPVKDDAPLQPTRIEDLTPMLILPEAPPPAPLDDLDAGDGAAPDGSADGPGGGPGGTGTHPGIPGSPDGDPNGRGVGLPGFPGTDIPLEPGGEVEGPVLLVRIDPEYPEIARRARIQGMVILEGVIGTDGRVESLIVSKSIPILDRAATDAVGRWIYRPGRQRGFLVRVHVTIRVDFRLN